MLADKPINRRPLGMQRERKSLFVGLERAPQKNVTFTRSAVCLVNNLFFVEPLDNSPEAVFFSETSGA